jgi:hypothetical protein
VWTLAAAMLAVLAYRQMVDAGFAVRHEEWRAEEAPEPLALPINLRDDASAVPAQGLPAGFPSRPGARAPSHEPAAGTAAYGRNATAHPVPGNSGSHRAGGLGFPRGAVHLLENTSKIPALMWLKRTLTMPIGERWLVTSLVASLYGPREVFIVLLAATTVAVVYMTIGRMLRSMAHA